MPLLHIHIEIMSGDTTSSLYIFYYLLLWQIQHTESYNRPSNRNQELETIMEIPGLSNAVGT